MVVEQEMQMSHDMRLLMSVAEQLKTPLTIMARQADLALLNAPVSPIDPKSIQTHSRAAMTLVDNYLLGLQLLAQQQALDLEPVSVSSTLLDASHVLEEFGKQYGIQLELHIAGRYEPVMAHRTALRSAILSLGFALIESAGAQQKTVHRITLAAHRTSQGIVAGLYGFSDLSAADWRRALQLQGIAQQPFAALSGTSAAGVFVADALGRAMDTNVRVGRYARSTGLAMTFQPSQQLQLI